MSEPMSDQKVAEIEEYALWACVGLPAGHSKAFREWITALIAEVRRLRQQVAEMQMPEHWFNRRIKLSPQDEATFHEGMRLAKRAEQASAPDGFFQETAPVGSGVGAWGVGAWLVRPLAWTKEPPTVLNKWYWWREREEVSPQMFFVTIAGTTTTTLHQPLRIADMGGEWAGPLTPPV